MKMSASIPGFCVRACLTPQSCLTLCDPMDYSHHAPLSMGFSRQEYWSGLPCPSPGDLPHPGMEPASLTSPPPASRFFTTSATWNITQCNDQMETQQQKSRIQLSFMAIFPPLRIQPCTIQCAFRCHIALVTLSWFHSPPLSMKTITCVKSSGPRSVRHAFICLLAGIP